ncbi:MAG: hypothetical protein BAJATHORv1_30469 [Candidatus Thorarchaeota archaeon]|nr:MAG: hypothetical protein BAJATHORv1_30469 [Candidatus Thorarchaeota archaeon]
MAETPICPYCGTNVSIQGSLPYDTKVKVNCPNCGSTFEYVSGFGAFSSDDRPVSTYSDGLEPRSSRSYDDSSRSYDTQTGRRDYLDPSTPIPDPLLERRRSDDSGTSCGKGCAIICTLCCLLDILLAVLLLILTPGFWFIFF